MKLLKVKRKTRLEPRYHKNMGRILVPVTKIYYSLFNIIPIKTLYKYRKTYHGKVKDCKDCKLDKIDNEII